MSYSTQNNTITLTRGDTGKFLVAISTRSGETYIPVPGDILTFSMKRHPTDKTPILTKDIPIDTLDLIINPEDTKNLDYGTYRFDIQLTYANGDVDTFIENRQFNITYEQD